MRTILPVLALALVACSATQKQKTVQALHVTRCVVKDDRLGKAIEDPEHAVAYLEGVQVEIAEIHAQITAMAERWKTGVPDNLASEVELMQQLIALLEDLEDLASRLQDCIQAGKGETAH